MILNRRDVGWLPGSPDDMPRVCVFLVGTTLKSKVYIVKPHILVNLKGPSCEKSVLYDCVISWRE